MEGYEISIVGAITSAIGSLFIAITNKHKRLLAGVVFAGALLSILGTILLGQEAEDLITGGDSYCYVTVQVGDGGDGWMTNPVVWCKGELPAYDVSVMLYDPESFSPQLSQEEFLGENFQFDVGTIWPGGYKMLSGTRNIKFNEKDRKMLEASVTTRNSFFQEKLLFKRANDHWVLAVRLYKTNLGGDRSALGDLVYEWAQPEFPTNDQGNILWDW